MGAGAIALSVTGHTSDHASSAARATAHPVALQPPPPRPSEPVLPVEQPADEDTDAEPAASAAERIEFQLMDGTDYATACHVIRGAEPGPALMVLGGVHGDEPASWRAAEQIATWEIARGALIVAPQVNHLAVAALARTFDHLSDLNRAYPGDAAGLPMERMAHEIVAVAREHEVEYLVDLHESWGFYADRDDARDGMHLGQLVVAGGDGDANELVRAVVDGVNPALTARERLILRDRHDRGWDFIGQGRSSISLGRDLPGCTPVLVEMAQHTQDESRRAEMHRMVVDGLLERLEMR